MSQPVKPSLSSSLLQTPNPLRITKCGCVNTPFTPLFFNSFITTITRSIPFLQPLLQTTQLHPFKPPPSARIPFPCPKQRTTLFCTPFKSYCHHHTPPLDSDPSLGKKIHSETPVPLFSKMSEYPFLKAREGREKQRYDGETRLVVGYRTLPLPHPLAAP